MAWSRQDIEWLEREWAYRAFGRAGLMSPEDFQTWRAWEEAGVPVEVVVSALNAYFDRRAQRARPRTFVALKHVAKDVEKAMKLRESLRRAGPASAHLGWEGVVPPAQGDALCREAFEAWRRAKAAVPDPTDAQFLDRYDAERAAHGVLVAHAETLLGTAAASLREDLRRRLTEAQLQEQGPLWARAWKHHWSKVVLEHFHIPCEV